MRFLWVLAVLAGCGGGAAIPADPIRVTAAEAHYRFPLTTEDSSDFETTVATLVARNAQLASPYDTGELAELYYTRAQVTGDRADYDRAETYASQSLALLASPNGARLVLAKLKAARHEFHEAIELATQQLKVKPSAGAYVVIATAELALGDLPAALSAATTAIAIKGDSSGYSTRALIAQAQGHDLEAEADFVKAAALEPRGDKLGAAHLRALWARFLVRRGSFASAKLVLDEATRIAPESAIAIAQRGELLLRTGHPADAVVQFDRAFELAHQVRYLLDEARARVVGGDPTSADELRAQVEVIVRKALADDPRGHKVDLIEVLVDRGTNIDEAVQLGREEISRRASWEVRFQYARALLRAGSVELAGAQIEAALAAGTREAQVYELAAKIEELRGHVDRAAAYRRQALELDPIDPGWRASGIVGPVSRPS
ncbi:MAG: hypothetical protein NT062_29990 [Proteobacteria bacterium]|nr:hypothetical protein [Pseudomonadota bacterium]